MTAPTTHIQDAHKLEADALVELFHVILTDGSHIYLKANNTVTWQGKTWEGCGIKMGGVSNSSDHQESTRPNLVIANPMGVFSSFVAARKLDRATIMRIRVLKTHLDSNTNIYNQQSWKVMKVAALDENIITVELRNQLDGPHFLTPARMFISPDFPMVTL